MTDFTDLKVISTDVGRAALFSAEENDIQLSITHVAAGSGAYTPERSATALADERERVEIDSSEKDLINMQLELGFALRGDDAYWVNEIGFFAADGTLVYLWSNPNAGTVFGYKTANAVFVTGLTLQITDTPLESINIIDNGRPLEISLTPIKKTLAGSHAEGELYEHELGNQLEAQHLLESDHTEYLAEILRGNGQSGVFNVRQYEAGGAYPWMRPNTVNYAALGMHSHWDTERICGMAEFSAVVNGYYIRTRHNDYMLRQPKAVGNDFLAVEDIDTPDVPADVTGTPEQQIAQMQQYFKVLHGEAEQNTVAHFDTAFEWALSHMEVWVEEFNHNVTDTFDNPRHQIDASKVGELVDKLVYFNASGHKNRLENLTFNHNLIRIVGKNGVPKLGTLKYRICVQKIGSVADYPIDDIVQPHEDLASRLASNLDYDNVDSRTQRFSFKQTLGGYDSEHRKTPELIDEIMSKVCGLDGQGANLTESFDQYGAVDNTSEYGTTDALNAAYYNRAYSITNNDASGRKNLKRGWNDPTLFVAKTTRPEVLALEIDADDPIRYSYAIPLELILLTPLTKWNPHGVPYLADNLAAASNPKVDTAIGRTAGNPMPGYNNGNLLFYHTPATFYKDGNIDGDPADTAIKDLYMQCADNTPRLHTPSGTAPILPLIDGIKKRVRLRYPVYNAYHEGSPEAAQLAAYKSEMQKRNTSTMAVILEMQDKIKKLERNNA